MPGHHRGRHHGGGRHRRRSHSPHHRRHGSHSPGPRGPRGHSPGHRGPRGHSPGHRGPRGHGGHGHCAGFRPLFPTHRPDFRGDCFDMFTVFDYGHVRESGLPAPKPDPSHQDVLQVENVDFNVLANTKRHHTDEYDITEGYDPQLVVRRGQEFTIQVDFSRAYDTQKDDLRLMFEIGDSPKPSKGTQVQFILSDKDEKGKWGAKIAQQSGKSVGITVFTPPDCIVGKWDFKVQVVKKKDTSTMAFRYNHKDPIYMLFNPYCREDAVFMENDLERQAYVLADSGKIYSGNRRVISPKPWVFGQFSGNVLECCMFLLELSEMKMAARGNVVSLVRKLSAMVNAQDEGGVLTGNWSGDYSGGKSPLSWTGSAPILEQFYRDKAPVRFGQCWVFSGVLTTVCRALGIPCRSVTNFASAHDSDASITIDMHYDYQGTPLPDEDEDSVWNFHVWNEAWMARPELAQGYGGWQACDATPQETSEGVFCCGPFPVRAIKQGEVNMPHDGPFIFAEVNADRVYWVKGQDGISTVNRVEKHTVGKCISTLSLTGDREDVTLQYKYPENSAEERVAVRRANQVGSCRHDVYEQGAQDVKFYLCFDSDNSFVGNDFEVKLCCTNTSKESRCIFGQVNIGTMYYTGVFGDLVTKKEIDGLTVQAGQTEILSIKVPVDKYQTKLKDCCMLSLSALARVVETKQIFTKKDDTRLRKPHLTIKATKNGNVGQEIPVEVSFTNPLPTTLTECGLTVEGPGLTSAQTYPHSDVTGKGTFHMTLKLKPAKAGKRTIIIIFSSKQLDDINSSHDIAVVV